MSRSVKKVPIGGFTTVKSEKPWKKIYNRILRRKVKKLVADEDAILPTVDEVMDKWDMGKDGKQYVSPNSRWYHKFIRK